MGTLYTIVSFRESHEDYCRGCLMGSSDSELKQKATLSRETAVEQAALWMADGAALRNHTLNKNHLEYASTEVTVMVNGWAYNADIDTDDFGPDFPDFLNEREQESKAIIAEATEWADRIILQKLQDKERAISNAEDDAKRKREAQERAQLAQLQAKYGDGAQ